MIFQELSGNSRQRQFLAFNIFEFHFDQNDFFLDCFSLPLMVTSPTRGLLVPFLCLSVLFCS